MKRDKFVIKNTEVPPRKIVMAFAVDLDTAIVIKTLSKKNKMSPSSVINLMVQYAIKHSKK